MNVLNRVATATRVKVQCRSARFQSYRYQLNERSRLSCDTERFLLESLWPGWCPVQDPHARRARLNARDDRERYAFLQADLWQDFADVFQFDALASNVNAYIAGRTAPVRLDRYSINDARDVRSRIVECANLFTDQVACRG